MRKLKLFKYPHAIGHLHDQIPEYQNTVPFSANGIAKWCQLVDPMNAELFYCGQFHDQHSDLLNPERFEYLEGRENKHLFDIEGDWNGKSIPEWLKPCLLTAMNAEMKHENWNILMRPPCSKLLMDIVKRGRPNTVPKYRGIFFRGQPDRAGVRQRMFEAIKKSGIPYRWEWTTRWNAPTPADDPVVTEYEKDLLEWSHVACPAGEGQQTCRYYETVLLERQPVVSATGLRFSGEIREYFADPTLYWINQHFI